MAGIFAMSEADGEIIRFECIVAKVQTLADGGIRAVFDLPETAVETMALLAYCQANAIALHAELAPETLKSKE